MARVEGILGKADAMRKAQDRHLRIPLPAGAQDGGLKHREPGTDKRGGLHCREAEMRVTNQMMLREALRGLQANLGRVSDAQERLSSGKRIRTPSDDPEGAARMMRMDALLRRFDQYRRNCGAAETRLSTEEAVLTAVREMVARVSAVGAEVSNDSEGHLGELALEEIRAVRQQVIDLANTRIGSEYIFGGSRTASPPFGPGGEYTGDGAVRRVEIADGTLIDTNHTGDVLFAPVLDRLNALEHTLENGDPAAIRDALGRLRQVEEDLLRLEAETGSRLSRLRQAGIHLGDAKADVLERRAGLADADPTEAVVTLMAAQDSLERTYAAVGRVISLSILPYLR